MEDMSRGARILAILGDSTDDGPHLPGGKLSPARWRLRASTCRASLGVEPRDFNTFGARRGNHEVMMRGTFGNVQASATLLRTGAGRRVLDGPPSHSSEEISHLRRRPFATRTEKVTHSWSVLAGKEYGAPEAPATGRPRAPACSACAR